MPETEDAKVKLALTAMEEIGLTRLGWLTVGANCIQKAKFFEELHIGRRYGQDPNREDAKILRKLGLLKNWYRWKGLLVSEPVGMVVQDKLARLIRWCEEHGYTLILDADADSLPGMALRITLGKGE